MEKEEIILFEFSKIYATTIKGGNVVLKNRIEMRPTGTQVRGIDNALKAAQSRIASLQGELDIKSALIEQLQAKISVLEAKPSEAGEKALSTPKLSRVVCGAEV